MQVKLVNAHVVQAAHALLPMRKRDELIIVLRVLMIIERAVRHEMGLALHMHDAAADELLHIRVLRGLGAQRAGAALLLGDAAVELTQRHIVAARGHEAVGHRAGVAHLALRGQMAHEHARRAAGRVLDRVRAVPEGAHIAQIAAVGRDLAPPGHVGALGAHLSAKGHLLADGLRPVIWQQLALHGVEHRVGAGVVGHKRLRPADFLYMQSAHVKRHKRAVHMARGVVHPHDRLEAEGFAALKP